MPLIVGIENGIERGFTERELSLTNGFGFGMLATNAGVGFNVWEEITVEEFRRRMLLCNFATNAYDMEDFYEIMTIEFCERLKDAEWYCNTTTYNKRKFNSEYKNWLVRIQELEFNAFERKMQRGGEE